MYIPGDMFPSEVREPSVEVRSDPEKGEHLIISPGGGINAQSSSYFSLTNLKAHPSLLLPILSIFVVQWRQQIWLLLVELQVMMRRIIVGIKKSRRE